MNVFRVEEPVKSSSSSCHCHFFFFFFFLKKRILFSVHPPNSNNNSTQDMEDEKKSCDTMRCCGTGETHNRGSYNIDEVHDEHLPVCVYNEVVGGWLGDNNDAYKGGGGRMGIRLVDLAIHFVRPLFSFFFFIFLTQRDDDDQTATTFLAYPHRSYAVSYE